MRINFIRQSLLRPAVRWISYVLDAIRQTCWTSVAAAANTVHSPAEYLNRLTYNKIY